jgi:hypothetical protein
MLLHKAYLKNAQKTSKKKQKTKSSDEFDDINISTEYVQSSQ